MDTSCSYNAEADQYVYSPKAAEVDAQSSVSAGSPSMPPIPRPPSMRRSTSAAQFGVSTTGSVAGSFAGASFAASPLTPRSVGRPAANAVPSTPRGAPGRISLATTPALQRAFPSRVGIGGRGTAPTTAKGASDVLTNISITVDVDETAAGAVPPRVSLSSAALKRQMNSGASFTARPASPSSPSSPLRGFEDKLSSHKYAHLYPRSAQADPYSPPARRMASPSPTSAGLVAKTSSPDPLAADSNGLRPSSLTPAEVRSSTAALVFKRRCVRACLADMAGGTAKYSGVAGPTALMADGGVHEGARELSPERGAVVYAVGRAAISAPNVWADSAAYAAEAKRLGVVPSDTTFRYAAPSPAPTPYVEVVEPIAMAGPQSRAVNALAQAAVTVDIEGPGVVGNNSYHHAPSGFIAPPQAYPANTYAYEGAQHESAGQMHTHAPGGHTEWATCTNDGSVPLVFALPTSPLAPTPARTAKYSSTAPSYPSVDVAAVMSSGRIAEALRRGHGNAAEVRGAPSSAPAMPYYGNSSHGFGDGNGWAATHNAVRHSSHANDALNHTPRPLPSSSEWEAAGAACRWHTPHQPHAYAPPASIAEEAMGSSLVLPTTAATCTNCRRGGEIEYFCI